MQQPQMSFAMPKPGRAVLGMMVAIVAIWVLFAVGINWGHADGRVLRYFVGSSQALSQGHLWVLLTAPLFHDLSEPAHLLTPVFALYFFGTTLEDRWGPKKLIGFLFGSAVFAYLIQLAVGALIAPLAAPVWYGSLGMTEAIAVAWALNNRSSTVRLFFVLPVSGTMLLVFIFAMSVLNVFARKAPSEGLITPFGGMLAGWIFGDASPFRRYFLELRLRRLRAETEALRAGQAASRRRAGGPPLRIIQGGGDSPPKDKRFLN
ncbi:MAG: rhomboid family intramembrane serine protease [Byssovorax sp.]